MATSGALGGFLQAMLQLRAQRLQEEEDKAKAKEQLMSGIGSGLSAAAKGIGSAFAQMGEDQMYNQLSTEAFGQPVKRATSANAGVQSAANLAAAQMPGGLDSSKAFGPQFTGGKSEFEGRMKLMELKDKINKERAADVRAGTYLDIAQQRNIREEAAATREANKASYTNRLFEQAPKDAKEIIQASLLYQNKVPDLVAKQQQAMADNNYEAYENAKREHQAYNIMATNKKLGTDLIPVEPYVSRDMAEKFAALSEAQAAAQGGGTREQRALQTAQQDVPRGEWMAPGATGLPANRGSYSPIPPGLPPYSKLDPGMLNRVAQGGQFTQPEAQQITGMQQQPQAGPAPGARPMTQMFRDKQTGQNVPFTWNPQTSKWERGQ